VSGGGRTAIVCDDAPGFRVLMSALLGEAGLDVTGLGETWADAEELAASVPDVIVVDLWMPTFDPVALGRVRASAPNATLAVVTAFTPTEAAVQVGDAGVNLFLTKSCPPTEIAEAIAAHAGATVR
jgi:DNA-binding NarL/FixJ family response regulator